jgi:hypothetical protein
MRFCSIAAGLGLAVSAAAGGSPAGDVPAHLASVVHADPRTGRLVRSIAVSGSPHSRARAESAWALAARSLDSYIRQTAERYQVDPLLVDSLIRAESNYDPLAVSSKGARGLMQLMPGTARRFSVANSFNPAENIDGGVRYLKYLLTLFGNERSPEQLALAAYNAGEGAVFKYGGVPPYRETTQYVKKVVHGWQARRAAEPEPQPETLRPRVVEFVDARGVLHIQTRYEP